MTNRAVASAETAESILRATTEMFADTPIADITLTRIAARSGVTVQTILRRFGEKDSVFAAAIERFAPEVFTQRGQAVPDDLNNIVDNLVGHYEQWGAMVLKMLAEQGVSPAIRANAERGAEYHRNWCARVFSGSLRGLSRTDRARRLAELTAICDLRTWEMLRLNAGLSRAQTETALREMLAPLMGGPC
jgi:AcrR family transcriptional regulator